MENGLVSPVDEGTPQGGPLSPLLSNLVLDELDRELERRGHRFVRYADDCNIYVGSERAGQRVMGSVTRFITATAQAQGQRGEERGGAAAERKFLGFSFTGRREPKRRIAPPRPCSAASEDAGTDATDAGDQSGADDEGTGQLLAWLEELLRLLRDALGAAGLDQWIRRRLRSVIWKQRKRRSSWHLANSPALSTRFPIAYFDSLGLPRLFAG